jgi:UDP-glucose 4-epimerase
MRVLVTGGAGFIGSHLAEELFRRGDEVLVLDDLSTGRRENLRHLENRVGFKFIEGSILDKDLVFDLTREADAIVHLAAALGVKNIMNKPYSALVTNVQGTENVVTAAVNYGRRTIIASTSEVYGKNAGVPLSEESDRILSSTAVIRWSYSTGKAIDETLALAAFFERGLPATCVRFFNTVGPRQSPAYGMVLPTLTRQAITGIPLTVYGTGTQTRSFSYVSDIVEGLLAILERPETSGEVFNLGSDEELTIRELADRILEITGSRSSITRIPFEHAYGPGYEDTMRRVPDISKARRMLGFDPKWALDDVIRAVASDMIGQPLPEPTGIRRPSQAPLPVPALEGARQIIDRSPSLPAPVSIPQPARVPAWSPGNGPKISVIVPVYNEAPSVAETVRRLRHRPEVHQLIVVNDGSTDGTSAELSKVADLIDHLVNLPRNQGKGAALRAGIAQADGDLVVFSDADLELDPAELPKVIAPLVEGKADAVFGNRIHEGNRRFMSAMQWQGNTQLSRLTNSLYEIGMSDMETAAKAFRREVLLGMQLEGERFEIEPEITAKLARMKVRVTEVPISFRPRRKQDGKKMNWWGSGAKAVSTLMRYRFWNPDQRAFSLDGLRRQPTWLGQTVAPAAQYLAFVGGGGQLQPQLEPALTVYMPLEKATMPAGMLPPPPAFVPAAPATAAETPPRPQRAPLNKERIFNGAPGEVAPPVLGVARSIRGIAPTASAP